MYASWSAFLDATTPAERRRWCAMKVKTANRERLMSRLPQHRITVADVLAVLASARGRSAHICGSLAVQRRPSAANGAPLPWEHVGRRVGSLGHVVGRFHGGANTPDNLGCRAGGATPGSPNARPERPTTAATTQTLTE